MEQDDAAHAKAAQAKAARKRASLKEGIGKIIGDTRLSTAGRADQKPAAGADRPRPGKRPPKTQT